LVRISDSSRTSRHFRKVPTTEVAASLRGACGTSTYLTIIPMTSSGLQVVADRGYSTFASLFSWFKVCDAMDSLTMTIASLDKEILLALNSFGGGNKDLWELANNSLFRGFPVFFSLFRPVVLRWLPRTPRSNAGRAVGGLLGDDVFILVTVSHRRPHTSSFGPSPSSANLHSTNDVGPNEFVSERHGNIVFRPCRGSLCRAAVARVILLCLGRSGYSDS